MLTEKKEKLLSARNWNERRRFVLHKKLKKRKGEQEKFPWRING
jgi:hypothetical protein